MRLLVRALWVFVFFTLFAFALNNEQPAVVNWFFGAQCVGVNTARIDMLAFSLGAALGVLAMVPGWWKQRRLARHPAVDETARSAGQRAVEPVDAQLPASHLPDGPPREGL